MKFQTDKINFGCGANAPAGWLNFDGSFRVLLERTPLFDFLGGKRHFPTHVRYLRVGEKLPLSSQSARFIYSSHMIEHLSLTEAQFFLVECFRILQSGGRIRLMTPSLGMIVQDYVRRKAGDSTLETAADQFMRELVMVPEIAPKGFLGTLLATARRKNWHQWLYDEESLACRLKLAGFGNIIVRENWLTDFPDIAYLEPADLRGGSICAEAIKP